MSSLFLLVRCLEVPVSAKDLVMSQPKGAVKQGSTKGQKFELLNDVLGKHSNSFKIGDTTCCFMMRQCRPQRRQL
jgi:hypothetical protein